MAKRRRDTIAQHYVYDPDTFEVLTQPGQTIPPAKVKRLQMLGLYEVAIGKPPVKLPIPSGFQPQAWGKKRKAIACVRLNRTKGRFLINGEPLENYFPTDKRRGIVLEPFRKLGLNPKDFTVEAYVTGAKREEGKKQPRAIAHALAGALSLLDDTWKLPLIRAGFRLQFDPPEGVRTDGDQFFS
ncbi:MAG: 30S ribosomal protein S9 [Candidatus Hydrothermarchaeota archaeon]|nr:MAG: 30S ribosomal protein S9 [Candidatus Hydrothermarchaeota archaeon]